MTLIRNFIVVAVACFAPLLVSAEDLNGFWKYTEEPGWIEINLDEGTGTVVRNDKYPERVGRELLKDLRADDSEEGRWLGQIYAEQLGEYKDAEITLPEPGLMEITVKVGFMSRTVEWARAVESDLQ